MRKTHAQFNAKQVQVYAELEAVVVQGKSRAGAIVGTVQLHFVDGKAGWGKTFLIYCLVTQFRVEGDAVLVVSTTGLSIIYYDCSCTAHSAFKIPVKEV